MVALYYKRQVRGNPHIMRFELEKLDRGAVVFVEFIGSSVVEVLTDSDYKFDVIEAMRLLKFLYIPKATPIPTVARPPSRQ